MDCGVSLSNAAHASQSPQSNTPPRAVAVRYVSLSQLAPINLLSSRTPSSGSPISYMGKLIPAHSTRTSRETGFVVVATAVYSLHGAGNRDYCAVATQGVSKRNPCWPGWRPAGGRGQYVYACHRALESSGDRRLRADHGTDRRTHASDFYI